MAKEYIPYDGPIVTRAQAKASGLVRYFTGKPCKRGHIAERIAAKGVCLTCASVWAKAKYQADPITARAKAALFRIENTELVRASNREWMRQWRAMNTDEANAQARLRRQETGDRIRAAVRARYKVNTDKIIARVRAWVKANPEKVRASGTNRRARLINAEGKHDAADLKRIFKLQKGKCGYCRTSIKGKYHADHIKPLARGGSNWPSNIQLLCPPCNLRKHARDPADFAREMGMIL